MGIYDLLSELTDERKGGEACTFNGYLEDYLALCPQTPLNAIFKTLLEKAADVRVIVNLSFTVSKKTVANAVICYKDIFKLGEKALHIPYILYLKRGEKERALLLSDDSYIYARGLYYALVEPGSAYQPYRNDFIALGGDDEMLIDTAFERLFSDSSSQLQRFLDKKHFKNYDEAYNMALGLAIELKSALADMPALQSDKERLIASFVIRWYLLKKFLYVQYMSDKGLLKLNHAGDVKDQRNKAKEYADSIRYIPFAELWQCKEDAK